MARLLRHRPLVVTALSVQLLAVLISFAILYTCTAGGIPSRNLSETAYWGTVGILGFMFLGMASPLTVFVIMVMVVLLVCGSRWKKVKFLSHMAFVLWGVYWILLAYEICAPPPD
jgi:hypothetical protein